MNKCLDTDRLADALVLASCGGTALWAKTQQRYFAGHKQAFIKNVVSAIVRSDLADLVAHTDLGKWKEALAVLLTYATAEKYK